MLTILLLDVAVIYSLRWDYADGPPIPFALHVAGALALLFNLPAYFTADALGIGGGSLRYALAFVFSYGQMISLWLVLRTISARNRRISPL